VSREKKWEERGLAYQKMEPDSPGVESKPRVEGGRCKTLEKKLDGRGKKNGVRKRRGKTQLVRSDNPPRGKEKKKQSGIYRKKKKIRP